MIKIENGYAICFNEWALDTEIKNELGLLLIISSLSAEKGYCFASNKYFAELFNTEEETISRKIKKLEKKDYIAVDYEKRGTQITSRKIRLTKISMDHCQKYQWTVDENVKDNNIINNNTSNNNIYGEFENVKLSDVEYEKLKERNLLPYIEKLSCYLKNNPKKKYASHYATILNWSRREVKNTKVVRVNDIPNWFEEEQDIKIITKSEQDEMESILKELGNE